MKKIFIVLMAAGLVSASSCKKYLDVNTNPNAPQDVTANLLLSPMLHWVATSPTYDGRLIGRYTQNITSTGAGSTWDLQGYDPSSDNGGQLWRDVYWSLGVNLINMISKSEAEQRWDLAGVGYALKAWGWLQLTDMHGEIIIKQAFDQTRTNFDYDSQEFAYSEVIRNLNIAIADLQRTDGAVDANFLGKTDIVYKGDRTKWLKFAYGLYAMTLNHFSNKSSLYKPDDIIAAVDKSFTSNDDNAGVKYTGVSNDDRNFVGPTRNNYTTYRQTVYILNMMNGTVTGGVQDPRLTRMLSPSPDGNYRGVVTGSGIASFAANTVPNNIWGYAALPTVGTPTRYIFDDKSRYPIMTYSELQFIKAEAAFKKGDKATALDAYTKGVSAHIDYVNVSQADVGATPPAISSTEKTTFMASPTVIPTAANLTLAQIMNQKYIALWGWGFVETWMDMRRYHYNVDTDPATGRAVYENYVFPPTLYADNGGKPAYRVRPRYNSEYVNNSAALNAIGALARDYHTKEMWITQKN